MATFLKERDKRELLLGTIAGIIAGTVSIIIASNYIATRASEKAIERTMGQKPREVLTEHIGNSSIYGMNTNSMDANMKNGTEPKLSVSIVTSEFYSNQWNPVLKHTFYGDTEEELESLIKAHKMTDTFFDASFKGIFKWKGTDIKLKNTVQYS